MKDLIIDVLELLEHGYSVQLVADRFGVSVAEVEYIVSEFGEDLGLIGE